ESTHLHLESSSGELLLCHNNPVVERSSDRSSTNHRIERGVSIGNSTPPIEWWIQYPRSSFSFPFECLSFSFPRLFARRVCRSSASRGNACVSRFPALFLSRALCVFRALAAL